MSLAPSDPAATQWEALAQFAETSMANGRHAGNKAGTSDGRFARGCSLSSWAYTVTTHFAFNVLRSSTHERSVIDRHSGIPAAAPSRRAEDDVERVAHTREQLERLRVHLARIKPEKAEALILHDVLGHDLTEIAALTGISVTAAQSRVLRGRR
jgi:RNA polymerase sigma factor (sigma-70 family)